MVVEQKNKQVWHQNEIWLALLIVIMSESKIIYFFDFSWEEATLLKDKEKYFGPEKPECFTHHFPWFKPWIYFTCSRCKATTNCTWQHKNWLGGGRCGTYGFWSWWSNGAGYLGWWGSCWGKLMLRTLLSQQDDFKNQPSMLETLIQGAGHECIFLPKFHCELNPIEMVSYLWLWNV